jgi:uncharacterized protein YjbJ (UPF0337 family)
VCPALRAGTGDSLCGVVIAQELSHSRHRYDHQPASPARREVIRMKWSIALVTVLLLGSVASAGAVDKDRVEGTGNQVKGSVKKGAGEVTGNDKLEREGSSQKSKGKLQEGWGKTKDAARDVGDSIKEKTK